jgi:hypothetical protein
LFLSNLPNEQSCLQQNFKPNLLGERTGNHGICGCIVSRALDF